MNGFTEKQWREFKLEVSKAAKLGTLEAVAEQKKDCRNEFVQVKDCQRSHEDVHKRINRTHIRINKIKKRPHMYELENAPVKDEPDATITFSLSDHFKAYWFRYVIGATALVVLTLLGYNVVGG